MSRLMFTIVWIVLATGLLTFMAVAWRARTKRDAALKQPVLGLSGDTLEHFAKVGYVSTTPVGAPLERVAVPGLSFKGWAELTVVRDGIAIEIAGEDRIEIPNTRLVGTDTASGRIGKVVESGGLSLLVWQTTGAEDALLLESAFRFDTPAEQRRFDAAIALIAQAVPAHEETQTNTSTHPTTSQEDS